MRVLGVGINATRNAPLDVFTEFAPPLVEVQTGAPGLSTEQVFSLVTVLLEGPLNGLPFLKANHSESVLASGPHARTQLVTDGSAKLFGMEFMTCK